MDTPEHNWTKELFHWNIKPDEHLRLPKELVNAAEQESQQLIDDAQRKGVALLHKNIEHWPGPSHIHTILHHACELSTNHSEVILDDGERKEIITELTHNVWKTFTANLHPEGLKALTHEIQTHTITSSLRHLIRLEQFYTELPQWGEIFYKEASQELKSIATDDSLLFISENPTLFTTSHKSPRRREIPDWIRGVILAHSVHGAPGEVITLNPRLRLKPNPLAFRAAILWALGHHLKIRQTPFTLEQTVSAFKTMRQRREQAKLSLRCIPKSQDNAETAVPPPQGSQGERFPWFLCWNIEPTTDIEVRDIAQSWIAKHPLPILPDYQLQTLSRVVRALCRQRLLHAHEQRSSTRQNWLSSIGVKEPILNYLKETIPLTNTLIFSVVYSELTWKQTIELNTT